MNDLLEQVRSAKEPAQVWAALAEAFPRVAVDFSIWIGEYGKYAVLTMKGESTEIQLEDPDKVVKTVTDFSRMLVESLKKLRKLHNSPAGGSVEIADFGLMVVVICELLSTQGRDMDKTALDLMSILASSQYLLPSPDREFHARQIDNVLHFFDQAVAHVPTRYMGLGRMIALMTLALERMETLPAPMVMPDPAVN